MAKLHSSIAKARSSLAQDGNEEDKTLSDEVVWVGAKLLYMVTVYTALTLHRSPTTWTPNKKGQTQKASLQTVLRTLNEDDLSRVELEHDHEIVREMRREAQVPRESTAPAPSKKGKPMASGQVMPATASAEVKAARGSAATDSGEVKEATASSQVKAATASATAASSACDDKLAEPHPAEPSRETAPAASQETAKHTEPVAVVVVDGGPGWYGPYSCHDSDTTLSMGCATPEDAVSRGESAPGAKRQRKAGQTSGAETEVSTTAAGSARTSQASMENSAAVFAPASPPHLMPVKRRTRGKAKSSASQAKISTFLKRSED